jgi:hypothetical protein
MIQKLKNVNIINIDIKIFFYCCFSFPLFFMNFHLKMKRNWKTYKIILNFLEIDKAFKYLIIPLIFKNNYPMF